MWWSESNHPRSPSPWRRGAFVGFDRQGQGGGNDAPVVPLVTTLFDAGRADHVLISGDAIRG
jgi:hypothetical protein